MGHPEIVYQEYIPFLPAIEDQVLPHHIPHMSYCFAGNAGPIAKLSVGPHTITPPHIQEEKTEQPHQDGEEEVLEFTQTPPYTVVLLIKI